MDSRLVIELDAKALKRVVGNSDGTETALNSVVSEITGKANSMGASFRTERTYNWIEHKHVGGTQPEYAGDVQRGRQGFIGLVHPNNYAAMKDNYLHNTLLKARG